jgi:hypothetical protein
MRGVILLAAVALAACGSETPQASETGEAAQLALEPIGSPEFLQYKISMSGCAFVPAGGGFAAPFVTDADKAYIKVNGGVSPLVRIGETYAGGGYSASLTQSGEGTRDGARIGRTAHLTITDGRGVKVYDMDGQAQCAA